MVARCDRYIGEYMRAACGFILPCPVIIIRITRPINIWFYLHGLSIFIRELLSLLFSSAKAYNIYIMKGKHFLDECWWPYGRYKWSCPLLLLSSTEKFQIHKKINFYLFYFFLWKFPATKYRPWMINQNSNKRRTTTIPDGTSLFIIITYKLLYYKDSHNIIQAK